MEFKVEDYFRANWKRYQPWLAKVENWSSPKEYDLDFGSLRQENCIKYFMHGRLTVGDVVYFGIKDTRQCYHERKWGVVKGDGLIEMVDKRSAFKAYKEKYLRVDA